MVDVAFGSGEHVGLIRLTPGETHTLINGMKGSKRLTLPHYDGLPMSQVKGTPCKVEQEADGEVILRLPLADWRRPDASTASPAPRKVAETPKALPAPEPAEPLIKLDMVGYLKKKGANCKRISSGVYNLEGDTVGPVEMLELVNSYRRREQLKPLDLAQVN